MSNMQQKNFIIKKSINHCFYYSNITSAVVKVIIISLIKDKLGNSTSIKKLQTNNEIFFCKNYRIFYVRKA